MPNRVKRMEAKISKGYETMSRKYKENEEEEEEANGNTEDESMETSESRDIPVENEENAHFSSSDDMLETTSSKSSHVHSCTLRSGIEVTYDTKLASEITSKKASSRALNVFFMVLQFFSIHTSDVELKKELLTIENCHVQTMEMPRQANAKDCGYYIMLVMKLLIQGGMSNRTPKKWLTSGWFSHATVEALKMELGEWVHQQSSSKHQATMFTWRGQVFLSSLELKMQRLGYKTMDLFLLEIHLSKDEDVLQDFCFLVCGKAKVWYIGLLEEVKVIDAQNGDSLKTSKLMNCLHEDVQDKLEINGPTMYAKAVAYARNHTKKLLKKKQASKGISSVAASKSVEARVVKTQEKLEILPIVQEESRLLWLQRDNVVSMLNMPTKEVQIVEEPFKLTDKVVLYM
ncbi:hypothetical protein L7F22_054339 [Adiantum nelumboides]|nr:hypothetical protein [Adiantum nelumboides]